jgi:hypothetical protein
MCCLICFIIARLNVHWAYLRRAGGAFFSGHKHDKKCIAKIQKYIDFLERKFRPGLMEDIVLKACPLMDAGTNISSISVQVLNDSDYEESTDI